MDCQKIQMKKIIQWAKWIIRMSFRLAILGFLGLLLLNWVIIGKNQQYLYNDLHDIPANNVGMVLGTSKRLVGGASNPYFANRVQAAYDLYKAEKIKHILVSGDNQYQSYNEPRDMYQALVAKGIPESCITLDYAGFRTLDSVVRSKEVFRQQDITIISQRFHNYRAVLVGRHYGIGAIAFNAKAPQRFDQPVLREYLARAKAVLDLYIFQTDPRFLGKKEPIFPCQQ